MTVTINKVIITAEAVFDYEEVITLTMPKADIKNEVEEHLGYLHIGEHTRTLRIRYLDEVSATPLFLFVQRGQRFGIMQLWSIVGICAAADWDEDLEDDGCIRGWLNTTFDTREKTDWVLDYRLSQERHRRLMEQTDNENYGEDYMKMVKELLKEYHINKARVQLGKKDDPRIAELADKMDFIDKAIAILDEESNQVITMLYIEKTSIRRLAVALGYSKSGMQRCIERAIGILEMLFRENYEIAPTPKAGTKAVRK